jgi:hypothetical protein
LNEEELPQQWKEFIILSNHNKGDEADNRNYHGILLLSITYKILCNILPSRLTPYIDEITGNHQCGF